MRVFKRNGHSSKNQPSDVKTKILPKNSIVIVQGSNAVNIEGVSREDTLQLNEILKKYNASVLVKQDIPL